MDRGPGSLTATPPLEEALPLTPMQAGMLFHRLASPGSGVDMEQIVVRMQEPLDVDRLVRAFDAVIAKHAVLRTRFDWRSREEPVQQIAREATIPCERFDWSVATEAESAELLSDWLRRDRLTDFDMTQPPLLRLAAFDLGPERSAFVFTFHHILLDGRSFPLVLREVFDLYDAADDALPTVPDAPPFADFVTFDGRPPKEASLAFFRALLDGVTAPTPLDVGFVARLGVKPSPRTVSAVLHSLPAERVRTAAARLGATPNTLFQAAWAIVLGRYARSDDVVFGATRACRDRRIPGVDRMVGLLIHTLPVRVRMPGGTTLAELLAGLREQHLEIRPHERTSVSDVQRLVGLAPGARLFDTIAVFDTAPLDVRMKALGPRFATRDFEYLGQTGFPLTLEGYLEPCLSLRLERDPVRYDEGTASRLLAHTCRMLEQLVDASPETRVEDLPLLTDEERAFLVEECNRTDGDFPSDAILTDAFEAQVDRAPDAVALLCRGARVTYAELEARANRLAHHLRERGVGPGARVGICLPRSIELVVAMLAIPKSGGAYVPLDPEYPEERLQFMLEDSGATVVVTNESLRSRLSARALDVVSVDGERELVGARSPRRPVRVAGPDDVAYVIYTSGSTGRPKGVVVRHRPAVNLVDWVSSTFGVGPSDRLLFVTSVCFDLSVYDVFGLLGAGGSVHVATSEELREPRALLSALCDGGITFWDSAPAALGQLVPFFPETSASSSLRLVFLSGDVIPVPLPDRIRAVFPAAEVVSLGGATEATVWSNFYRIGQVDLRWPTIPYGRPIRNARYYVLDERLEPLPIGVPGELFIGGHCLADGYHARPELNAEKFLPNPFQPETKLYRTGDRARFMPDGNLEFLGRIDHQVKVRGYRIELGEIEAALNGHPGVSSCLVLAPRGASAERTLVAYVVAPGGSASIDDLRATCRARLPEYMVPSRIVVLEELPLTPNGKVDRAALPSPDSPTTEFVAPRNDHEEAVARVFADCLGRDRVGIRDGFYELGGHSLAAVRILGEILRRTGHELSLADFLGDPTVEAVAARLAHAAQQTSSKPHRLVHRPGAEPLVSFAQRRLLFLQRLDPESAAYNVTIALRLEGEVDTKALHRAVLAFVERHEPLRTSFVPTDDGERAIVHDQVAVPFVELDLRDVPDTARDDEVDRFVRAQSGLAFDPGQAPLLRVSRLRLDESTHLVVWVVHHAVFDGASAAVLRRELVELHDAFAAGRPSPLAPPTIRFRDFAWAQRDLVESSAFARELRYVHERLGGELPILALPHDRPRPARPSHGGGTFPFALPPETSLALARVAEREGTTLFVVLLAAYFALLHRFTGQTDLLVGTPVSSREEPETSELVGLLLDTVVVRIDADPAASFPRWIAHVRERFLEALAHRALPFERLVEEIRPPRDPSVTPITQTFFSFEETTGRVRRGERFELTTRTSSTDFARTDLSLFVERSREEGIHGYFEYATDLFDPETVSTLCAAYRLLLDQLSASNDMPVARLSILSDSERARQLSVGNDTDTSFDFDRTVVHRFEERARTEPDRLAIVFRSEELTYGELARRVQDLADRLDAMGVGPGDGVGIFLDRSPRLVVAMLAALRVGAHYVPLDPTHPAERNGRILRLASPRAIVTEGHVSRALPEGFGERAVDLDALPEPTARVEAPPRTDPAGLAYVIFTSGSTGDPKGVEITHRSLVNFLCSMAITPGMRPSDHLLAITTPSFDIAALELFLPLVTGASLEIAERADTLDPDALARRLAARPATVFQATPATYRMLIDAGWRGLLGLRALCGGEPMPVELARELAPRVSVLYNVYGPTETTIWSSLDRVDPREGVLTIGMPIHNTRMYVLDDALEPVPRGVMGMLYIGGEGLSRGYHRRDDLTASAFVDAPFASGADRRLYRTGDLARRLPDGRLECLGRSDFQVKIRGHRIELGEIEARIAEHPDVRAAVVHVDRSRTEPSLVAFVVPVGPRLGSPEGLLDNLRGRLPSYMVPARVVELEELPLTPNGKVDRKALRVPPASEATTSAGIEPRDDTELRVAYVFERLLGSPPPCVRASFFDLGGNSLLTVRLVRELEQAFGLRISIGTVFAHPTVEGLARELRKGARDEAAIVLPLAEGRRSPPVFFVCGIHVYRTLARGLGPDRPAYGIFLPEEQAFFERDSDSRATVEQLASEYVKAMRRHTPEGPYVLAGLSFGALLAFEMARQLREEGSDVPLVVLVDAVLPGSIRRGPRWVLHRLRALSTSTPASLLAKLEQAVRDRLDPPPIRGNGAGTDELESLRASFYGRAAEAYARATRPYDGRVLLVCASERGYEGYDIDPLLGWGERVRGDLRVFQSEGDHLGVVRSERTAEIVRDALNELPRSLDRPESAHPSG